LAPGAQAWQLAQGYGANAGLSWNTAGKPAGTYSLSIWARDNSSLGKSSNPLGSWDAYTASQFTLTTSPCGVLTVTAAPPASAPAGSAITITGAATGCPAAQYQFWVLTPGSSTWQLVQGYSSTATLNWNTTGKPPGLYRFSVWTRDGSSLGTSGNSLGRWDAYAAISYSLT
jgi:hypothetical protein